MPRTRVTEEEARRLWERAAQLQEEARRALDGERTGEALVAPGEGGGFELEHVRQAAAEAGIDASFVDSAWTEAQIGVRPSSPGLDRKITWFLGQEDRAIEVVRIIDAPPAGVFESVLEVATSDRCKLQPLDWIGGHPLEGGALAFRAPTYDLTTSIGTAAAYADLQALVFRFQDLGDDRTEVRVRCSIERGRKLHFWLGLPFVGLACGGSAAAVATVVSLALAPAVAVAAGATALAAGAWGGLSAWRGIYGWSLGKGRTGVDDLLQQISVHARTRFRRETPSLPPRGESAGG